MISKFHKPISFSVIVSDDTLREWTEVRRRFVRSGVPVPMQYWQRLFELAGENRGHLEQQAVDGLKRLRYERDIQDWLYRYPAVLAPHALDRLADARKEVYLADGGRADLVYT